MATIKSVILYTRIKILIFTKKADGRSAGKYSIWESRYTWAYFSNYKEGWFCKICQEYSSSGDEFWKTLPYKHDRHPTEAFE